MLLNAMKVTQFQKLAQKMEVGNKRGDKVDVTKVYDKDRNLKTGSEVVKVWKKHFKEC